VCCATALANINIILKERLIQRAAKGGRVLHEGLNRVGDKFPRNIAAVQGRGMVAGVHMVKPSGTREPDSKAAFDIVERCMERGLLMFAPVGFGSATVKISPPLVTPIEAIREGLGVFQETMEDIAA